MTTINGLNQQIKSPHSPSPIYGDGSVRMNTLTKNAGGLRPGFTVGDLDQEYAWQVLVYGTYNIPSTASGTVTSFDPAYINSLTPSSKLEGSIVQTSTVDAAGTTVNVGARCIKVTIHVSGTGTVDITMKTAADTFTAVIFDSGALAAGSYTFYVGGWASPSADANNRSYIATQYGPRDPRSANPGVSEDVTLGSENITANSNYVGKAYNPIEFISLDGQALKFFSAKSGTPSWDVEVTPVS